MPGPANSAAARPVSTKIPVPMMQPMPSDTRLSAPRLFFSSPCACSACWRSPCRQRQPCGALLQKPLLPTLSPGAQRRPEVYETLQGKQVRPERDNHEVGTDEGGSVDRPEIGAEIDEDHVGPVLITRPLHEPPEGRHDAEGAWIAAKALGPDLGKIVFKGGQSHIAKD